MQIRKAKIEDVPRIAEMGVDFMRYLAEIDPYLTPSKEVKKVYLAHFKKAVHSGNRFLLVAEENGKIIGYALAKISRTPPVVKIGRYGVVDDVYLEKKYRGRGIAGQFLEEMYAWFGRKGISNVELYVLPKNKIGRNAWKKYGFKEYTLRLRKKI